MAIIPLDTRAEDDGSFSVSDRAIFCYGGGIDLRADPLAVERRYNEALASQSPDVLARWLQDRNYNQKLLAFRRLIPVSHAALGTSSMDEIGAGLTGPEVLAVIDRFWRFRDRIAREERAAAEWIATYGPVDSRPMTYRRFCGLWWNRHRVQAIAGVNAYRAAAAARGGSLPFVFADAMGSTLEEAHLIHEQAENDRVQAEAKAEFLASQRPR